MKTIHSTKVKTVWSYCWIWSYVLCDKAHYSLLINQLICKNGRCVATQILI